VKTITNAILEICLITGGFLAGLKVYLGSITDCENHYKCNLRNLIFTGVFLPGLKVYLGSLTVITITNAILEILFLLV
jgi:hypothetical protein